MSVWSFRRRHGACAVCEREFEAGEPHFSALLVLEDGLAREDLCRTCRRNQAATQSEPGPWVFWWRTRHEVGKKKGLALNLEAIEALFLGLEGRAEKRLRELRYVLCLLLMRKRRLKIERILRDSEGEAMIVRRPRRQESLRVFVFDFDAERMGQLREELRRVFDSEEGLNSLAEAPTDSGEDEVGEGGDGGHDPGEGAELKGVAAAEAGSR